MMEHIRQYDWYTSEADDKFLNEEDIDNSCIERILANKFIDPAIESASESEDEPLVRPTINWEEVFKRKNNDVKRNKLYVPGLRPTPPYPKLSALTLQQHYQCLKVLCNKNPTILEREFMPRPTKTDYQVFEEVKDVYLKEQQEYQEWARSLWQSTHCIRALRPKLITEMVYEAEFKMRANELSSFPKHYEMAAHISLDGNDEMYEMVPKQDLVKVNLADLPKIRLPDLSKKCSVMRPCPMPEPCSKHPCWFILPNEKSLTVLPLTEIHRELAQYALDNGVQYIASEGALRCIVETDRDWLIPISVCEVIDADGEKKNVFVFGSEFTPKKKSSVARTYKAYRHLLEYALIPPSERARLMSKDGEAPPPQGGGGGGAGGGGGRAACDLPSDSDDEDGHLVINEDVWNSAEEEIQNTIEMEKTCHNESQKSHCDQTKTVNDKKQNDQSNESIQDDYYECCCNDTLFEYPPQRSFKKWQIRDTKTGDHFDMIVHCSHKMKTESGEAIVEPIPEYQVDVGGSRQSDCKLASLALALALRNDACLYNVRVDALSGDVVTVEGRSGDQLGGPGAAARALHRALGALSGLLPGRYLLQHHPSHGQNAFLYATRAGGGAGGAGGGGGGGGEHRLSLEFDCSALADDDEARGVHCAPAITNVLLPVHKSRKILPCAFTPFAKMVVKETKKQPAKSKPPQGIQWPKRKKRQRKNKNKRT